MLNKIIIILFLFLSINAVAQNDLRQEVSLNGTWRFITDPDQSGLSYNWDQSLGQDAVEVKVPHTWNVMKGYEDYNGRAWYEKTFFVPEDWKKKHIRIRFAAVYHDAVIYLNGKKVKEHSNSGYTTFYADITEHVKFDANNTLILSVNNEYSDTMLPYKRVFDWSNDGGIIREVTLIASAKPSIRYVHITPDLTLSDSSAEAKVKIMLWEEDVKRAKFRIAVREKESKKVILEREFRLSKDDNTFMATLAFPKVHLWHFNDPFLYEFQVTAFKHQTETDELTEQFGFRKIALEGKKLLVNNEPVRLPGIEYMPSSHPNYGSAEPKWVMDSVVNMMKDLNVVITRFHWQVDEYILDLMDEKGILVQAEIPWWQQPGKLSPALRETAKMQLSEMIERDYNHPCIFAWGISNEVFSTDSEQYYILKDFVKAIDSTRMVNVVSNETYKRKEMDESLIGDLPTWNDYVGTWYGDDMKELPGYFDIMESFLGNRPLLITENGLCEPRFSGGDLRRTNAMIYHFREWAKRDYIIGCIYFSLNDYRTQRGEDGAKNFKARIHGVTDLYFNKKPSYYIFKQLASPVEIRSVRKLSDTEIKIELFNKNSLPSYTLKGYKVTWTTTDGEKVEKLIPVMRPGDEISLSLEHIQPHFTFEIISPTGYHVSGYPIGINQ